MDPITSILIVAFVAGLLHYGITKQRARRDAYITHLVSSGASAKELMDKRIRELEIECGIVEASQKPVTAPLSPVEQFLASVDAGEAVVPLSAVHTGSLTITAQGITVPSSRPTQTVGRHRK